ncbi:MAG: hypothetical protein MI724_04675 [Spirochaetales bacterium]|nr:hypothetical protein [Spirochaetales bacterium]
MVVSKERIDDREATVVRSQVAMIGFFMLSGFFSVLKRVPQSTTSGFIHSGAAVMLGGVFLIPKRYRPIVQLILWYLLATLFGAVGALTEPEGSVLFVVTALYARRYRILLRYRWIALALTVSWFVVMVASRRYYSPPLQAIDRSVLGAIHYTLFWTVIVYVFIVAGCSEGRTHKTRVASDRERASAVEGEAPFHLDGSEPLSFQLQTIARIAEEYEMRLVVPGRLLSHMRALAESGLDRLSTTRDLIFNPDPEEDNRGRASGR